jgi:hypothetical protein
MAMKKEKVESGLKYTNKGWNPYIVATAKMYFDEKFCDKFYLNFDFDNETDDVFEKENKKDADGSPASSIQLNNLN